MKLPPTSPNPFRGSIVDDPWRATTAHVAQVHQHAFAACCQAVELTRTAEQSAGVLILGMAGSGKTHLLSQIRAQFAVGQASDGDTRLRQVFVSIRMATSPRRIWRHIRERFAEDLLRRLPDGRCQLEHVLALRLAAREQAEVDYFAWWEAKRQENLNLLIEALDDLVAEIQGHNDLSLVLQHTIHRCCRRQVRGWLRGDSLPKDDLEELGILHYSQPDEEEDAREAAAQGTVLALCRLIGPGTPVVFCFDQIEALRTPTAAESGLKEFGDVVADLHDNPVGNATIITTIQSNYFRQAEEQIRPYAHDRLTSFMETSLQPLLMKEAKEIVSARLRSSPQFALAAGADSDPLWPLSEGDVREIVGRAGCTPRELISACADRFTTLQGCVPKPRDVPQALADHWQTRYEEALEASDPANTEHILSDGLPYLMETSSDPWRVSTETGHQDVHLEFAGTPKQGKIGVSFCTQGHMTSLAARLRRLMGAADSQQRRLVLIRDSRTPISAGAKATQERLKKLEEAGAVFCRPTPEVLAALDALRLLLADAASGDLAVGGETVTPQTVVEWLRKNLAEPLAEFRNTLLGSPTPNDEGLDRGEAVDQLVELVGRNHVVSLDEAARELQQPPEQIAATARRSRLIGVLDQPPGVLFQRVDK